MIKVLTVLGTRPEAIKLSPIIHELSKRQNDFQSLVGTTGQHDEILRQVLDLFDIRPDFSLEVMKQNQGLTDLTATILKKSEKALSDIRPDILLIQGDTTTVFTTALAAYYQKIMIAHVEAGLRTSSKYQPFPEEMNRRLTDQMSDIFFAPTERNRLNLLVEGIPDEKIFVTGNTVVDALLKISATKCLPQLTELTEVKETLVLITAHRRENFGAPLENIFGAIRRIANMHPNIRFVYPLHPNPNVRNTAIKLLSSVINIKLLKPLDYLSFLHLMRRSYIIISDSGGIQEEAPSLNKPVLIIRETTERPELVEAGGAILVGSDKETICKEFNRLIEDKEHYRRMTSITNPFGDGSAAKKIVDIIADSLSREKEWKKNTYLAL
jgi:UDP-N-acetylglucosamine 2-epimerase (non-hydrolysing)